MESSKRLTLHERGNLFTSLKVMALPVIAALVVTGCSGKGDVREAQPANMGPADRHRVQSEELRRTMQTMNLTLYEREATALDVEEERLLRARRIASLLKMISQEIVYLAGEDGRLALTPEDKQLFLSYADDLGAQAESFGMLADQGRAEEFLPAMRRVVKTCNACHDRFRDM